MMIEVTSYARARAMLSIDLPAWATAEQMLTFAENVSSAAYANGHRLDESKPASIFLASPRPYLEVEFDGSRCRDLSSFLDVLENLRIAFWEQREPPHEAAKRWKASSGSMRSNVSPSIDPDPLEGFPPFSDPRSYVTQPPECRP